MEKVLIIRINACLKESPHEIKLEYIGLEGEQASGVQTLTETRVVGHRAY